MFHVKVQSVSNSFKCDGKKLDLAAGPSLEGIAILNIPSYAGGTHPWGEVDKKKSRKKNKKAKFNGKDDNEWAEQGNILPCIHL